MPVKIPVQYVPRARVDFDAEQRQLLGYPLVLSDGFRVPPLTPARLLALELVCSQFFLHPDTCDILDAAAAVVLVSCERNLVEELVTPQPDDTPGAMPAKLAEVSATFIKAHGEAIVADYVRIVEWIMVVPNYGFDMLPKPGDAPRKPCWYDGEFVGAILAPAAKLLAIPFDRLLWETPVCTIGHAVAQRAAALGVKGVERPPDRAVLKAMIREAAEREARGELHPWQFQDPIGYNLTQAQANANPALIELFASMRAEYERNGHKPLDPEKFPIPPAPNIDPVNSRGAAEQFTATVQDLSWSASEAEETMNPVNSRGAAEQFTATVQDLSWSASEAECTAAVEGFSSCASEAERTAAVEETPHHG